MTRATPSAQPGHEFDDFLFAPISEGKDEMAVSVVSALARLDLDPWHEAAELTRMPIETAARRLASLLVTPLDELSTHCDAGKVADRLLALLPRQTGSDFPSSETLLGTAAAINLRSVTRLLLINLIAAALVLGAQYLVGGSQWSALVDGAHASSPGTMSPHVGPEPVP